MSSAVPSKMFTSLSVRLSAEILLFYYTRIQHFIMIINVIPVDLFHAIVSMLIDLLSLVIKHFRNIKLQISLLSDIEFSIMVGTSFIELLKIVSAGLMFNIL